MTGEISGFSEVGMIHSWNFYAGNAKRVRRRAIKVATCHTMAADMQ
jgi:hypothetical protein